MNFIANIIWLILGGIIFFLLWFVGGILLCLTIVGIPFALQHFKIAGFVLWPFGRKVEVGRFGVGSLVLNIIWIIFIGIELAILHLLVGLILCVSIVGIPFGLQHFKLARIGLIPFGAKVTC